MANEIDAYKAAMSRVKDMSIDPNTGKVTRMSNKSIVVEDRAKIEREFLAQAGGDRELAIKLSGESSSGKTDEAKALVEAYRNNFVGKPNGPVAARQDDGRSITEAGSVVKVGKRPDEDVYMRKLVENCRKRCGR